MRLITQDEFNTSDKARQREILIGLDKKYKLEVVQTFTPLPDDSHELEPEPQEKVIRIPTRTSIRLHNLYATWVQEEIGISLENW